MASNVYADAFDPGKIADERGVRRHPNLPKSNAF
jgi:hypothetical protein